MKFNKWALMASITGSVLFPMAAQAIEVFPVVKEIRQITPRENYIVVKSAFRNKDTVENNKSETQQYEFVTLELFHVPNPGDQKEIREKVLGTADPTLVFSPTRLVIPYGEERKVRIMPLKTVSHEEVYRLRIRPSYPEQAIEKGKVRFAVGYDVLLRYLPPKPHTQGISISCKNGEWTLKDTGNVRSELRNLVIDGRKAQPQYNVYPDNTRVLKVHNSLSFELEGKLQTYEQCKLK